MTQNEIKQLRAEYPKGTILKCIYMDDTIHPIPYGTLGRVDHIDDLGTIHMKWDNGSSLGLIYGTDIFEKVSASDEIK